MKDNSIPRFNPETDIPADWQQAFENGRAVKGTTVKPDPMADSKFIDSVAVDDADIALTPYRKDALPALEAEGWFLSQKKVTFRQTEVRLYKRMVDVGHDQYRVQFILATVPFAMVSNISESYNDMVRFITDMDSVI